MQMFNESEINFGSCKLVFDSLNSQGLDLRGHPTPYNILWTFPWGSH